MKRDYTKEFFEALDARDGPRLIALHDDFNALWERNPEAAAMATRAISAGIVRRKRDAEKIETDSHNKI